MGPLRICLGDCIVVKLVVEQHLGGQAREEIDEIDVKIWSVDPQVVENRERSHGDFPASSIAEEE